MKKYFSMVKKIIQVNTGILTTSVLLISIISDSSASLWKVSRCHNNFPFSSSS